MGSSSSDRNAVHADDHLLPRFHRLLIAVAGVGDLALRETRARWPEIMPPISSIRRM